MDDSTKSAPQDLLQSDTKVSPLRHVQERFGIVDLGGELRLIDLRQLAEVKLGISRSELSFYSRTDGNIKMERALEALPANSKPKIVIKNFWVSPSTRVFDSIAFTPKPTGPETINYWVPPTAKPVAGGNWQVLDGFLLEVICAGDAALHQYIRRFLAHMLQHPEEKPGIVIVLLGGQGTGKGTFFRILHRIWSRTTLIVSDVNAIVGDFNAALERNFVVCMDEALFSGDKKSIERMKSLVTEPVIHVEQKYQPSRCIDSFHRFFATSNNEFFGQVDSDDRRFVFLRVADTHKTNSIYFDALHRAIDDDGCIGAMVHDLLQLDLTGFNPRSRPKTKEHLSQRLQSLAGFDRYWYEKLCQGRLPQQYATEWEPRFVATADLQEGYRQFDPQAQRYRPLQDDQIAARLRKFCASADRARRNQSGGKSRGYSLPDLAVARKEFTAYIGGDIDWDVPDAAEEPKT